MGITEIGNAANSPPIQTSNSRPAALTNDATGVRDSTKSAQPDTKTAATAVANETHVPPEELKSAVEKVQKFVSTATSDVQFSIDKDTGSTVVKVVDRNTQEVLRQIPSKEMLEMAKAIDRLQGLLVKNQA